jgi:hypothetical protein
MADRLVAGSDHAGLALRAEGVRIAREAGLEVEDLGPFSGESVDYPDYARQVAEAVAAEVLSAIPLDDVAAQALQEPAHLCTGDGPGVDARLPGSEPGAAHGCTPHAVEPAPTPFLRALVEGLAEADAFELDALLRRAVHLEQRLHAELGPLLLELARSRAYRAYGCPSLDAAPSTWARS